MDEIITEYSESILRVELNRPTKRNAMTSSMYSALAEILNEADKDERARRVGYLKEIIANAQYLGTPYVISETGTFNTESDWVDRKSVV